MMQEILSSRRIGDQAIAKPENHEGLPQSAYALLTPGQGDPVGIVRTATALSKHYSVAHQMMEDARKNMGFSLTGLDDQDLVRRTKNAQPAIYLSTLMIWRVYLEELGFSLPEAVAGYSLGDYAAAQAAGLFDPMEGLGLVKERGAAYQECNDEFPTGMISVLGSTNDQREALFREFPEMAVCLINSVNDNLSIGGPREKLDGVKVFLTNMGVKTLPNPAPGAFHSKYYETARVRVEEAMAKIRIRDVTKIAFITREGKAITDGRRVAAELIDQTNTPFDWNAKSEFLEKNGTNHLAELAQDTLAKMARRRFGGRIEPITAEPGLTIGSRWKLNPQSTS